MSEKTAGQAERRFFYLYEELLLETEKMGFKRNTSYFYETYN